MHSSETSRGQPLHPFVPLLDEEFDDLIITGNAPEMPDVITPFLVDTARRFE